MVSPSWTLRRPVVLAGLAFASMTAEGCAPDPPTQRRVSAKLAAERSVAAAGPAVPRDVDPEPAADVPLETVDGLEPYFTTPETARAVEDYLAGRNHPAAKVLEEFADARRGTPAGRAARFLSLLARHDGGVFDPTAERLEALAARWPAMSDYALFYAGSAHLHAGRPERALLDLDRIEEGSTLRARAVELASEALVALGRKDEAIRRLETALARDPGGRPELWDALDALRGARERPITADGWLREGRRRFQRQAHEAAKEALALARDAYVAGSPERCEATVLLARTLVKQKLRKEALPFFDESLACVGEPLADATFAGARARLDLDDLAGAERYLRRHLESFPARSTADDAQVLLAEVVRKRGDDAEADRLLWQDLELWPRGDMAEEASWSLLWPRIERKRWKEALDVAERLLVLVPRERTYRAEGRTLYWKGRALQHLRRPADAAPAFEAVLAGYPLSWYALLAFERLRSIDPDRAVASLRTAAGAPPPEPDPLARIPESLANDPHFRKGVELGLMGLGTSARRELSAARGSGADGDRRAEVWTKIALLDRAGAHAQATALARAEEPDLALAWPAGHHERLWTLAHPRPFSDLVLRHARERGVDPFWIWSIMREESGFDPDVESWANAVGLMQIILPTAKMLAKDTGLDPTPADLRRPEVAVDLGTKYLAKLLSQHPSIPLASAGYNAGGGAVSRWRKSFGGDELDLFVEKIPFREANGYAKRVTRSYARYTWLYGGGRLPPLSLSPPGRP